MRREVRALRIASRRQVYPRRVVRRKQRANLEAERACGYSPSMSCGSEGRFPVTMRLKRHGDFLRVFRNGRAATGTCLVVHVLPCDAGPRLGIVVSRKYGSAVERNLAKRRIREAFRRCAKDLPKVDIVVRPQAGCRESTVTAIEELLRDGVSQSMNREGRS